MSSGESGEGGARRGQGGGCSALLEGEGLACLIGVPSTPCPAKASGARVVVLRRGLPFTPSDAPMCHH